MNIREYRRKMNKTQAQVAKDLGISQSYYFKIEDRQCLPPVYLAKRIAAYFGFDWTLFFEKNDNKKSTV